MLSSRYQDEKHGQRFQSSSSNMVDRVRLSLAVKLKAEFGLPLRLGKLKMPNSRAQTSAVISTNLFCREPVTGRCPLFYSRALFDLLFRLYFYFFGLTVTDCTELQHICIPQMETSSFIIPAVR